MPLLTDPWRAAYPGALAGMPAMAGVVYPPVLAALEARKQALEQRVRTTWAGRDRQALAQTPPLPAYAAYYKAFKKTYRVQGQLESIAFKGRSLPSVAALVEAMFMAELVSLVLTAGHDLDQLTLPVTVGLATGAETYTVLRGTEQALKAGDMLMADQAGVISSILYDPDQRTAITADTRRVLFTCYAPDGVGAERVRQHLGLIRDLVHGITPVAVVIELAVYP
jgi:DNA/RNA-binding domain of Phe-tRNA-synthetase-like protein